MKNRLLQNLREIQSTPQMYFIHQTSESLYCYLLGWDHAHNTGNFLTCKVTEYLAKVKKTGCVVPVIPLDEAMELVIPFIESLQCLPE